MYNDSSWCDPVCQWFVTGWWFSPGTFNFFSLPIKTEENNITGILLNVAFNTNNYNRIMWKINIKNYKMWYYKNNLITEFVDWVWVWVWVR
jgi:hypothetical protein